MPRPFLLQGSPAWLLYIKTHLYSPTQPGSWLCERVTHKAELNLPASWIILSSKCWEVICHRQSLFPLLCYLTTGWQDRGVSDIYFISGKTQGTHQAPNAFKLRRRTFIYFPKCYYIGKYLIRVCEESAPSLCCHLCFQVIVNDITGSFRSYTVYESKKHLEDLLKILEYCTHVFELGV